MGTHYGNFAITSSHGFHLTLPNGVTISTQFGGGNYGDNYDMPIGTEKDVQSLESSRVEIAIWDAGRDWITGKVCRSVGVDSDDEDGGVAGYLTMSDWLKVLNACQSWGPPEPHTEEPE